MPPHPHSHWRSAVDWKTFGLEFSTTSDEACKLYDACLTQIVNHFEDEALGGTAGCLEKMFEADPDFLMGYVLKLGTSGQMVHKNNAHAQAVAKMAALAEQPHVKPWERKHVLAVQNYCEGKASKASAIWEDILVEYPTDLLSLKFLHDTYIFSGSSQGLRGSCSRVQPYWKPHMPCYGDVRAMYAFGLEETNMFIEAEKIAREALEVNRHDAWAAHCVAHVKEMTGQFQEGEIFMSETENDWNDNALRCHNYWHWSLFHVENGDFDDAIGLLDGHVVPFMKKSEAMFAVSDAASLCFRLEAEGHDVVNYWNDCYEVCKSHVDDTSWSYYDINMMLACLGSNNKSHCDLIIAGVKENIKEGIGDNARIYNDVTLPVLEAFQAYDEQNYDLAVEIIKPLKYELYRVGGSNAQRDLLNIFAIHAALRSTKPENRKYASHLLMERQSQKKTPLADRLLQRIAEAH